MKVKMNGHNVTASEECLSDILLAIGFAMEHCDKNELPTLMEVFHIMHSDLYEALIECGYFKKDLK